MTAAHRRTRQHTDGDGEDSRGGTQTGCDGARQVKAKVSDGITQPTGGASDENIASQSGNSVG